MQGSNGKWNVSCARSEEWPCGEQPLSHTIPFNRNWIDVLSPPMSFAALVAPRDGILQIWKKQETNKSYSYE
ncbi:uncharacterized protein N7483_005021 [Penicillium malachiteum]|uniref:uncharacterized protein n=1 Tax=Penicillium malachiteum TaxID=1324776 RepID=UPI002549A702|nr:uncharacterized protein N7483_005021 [Penicillium malachiteum]KAJ5730513.1 hypothetical protein N7483_005021 [Penicillium malachiteum]